MELEYLYKITSCMERRYNELRTERGREIFSGGCRRDLMILELGNNEEDRKFALRKYR